MAAINTSLNAFSQLQLDKSLLKALAALGYEQPTPVQQASIPLLLSGADVLAQAQTGTGKTAAFALPILSQVDFSLMAPQALVVVPTRELAIQVAEAFQGYAKFKSSFHVAPIYGGQDYRGQLRALKRGAQVIVGTPGRVMDHLRRGSLLTDNLKTVVLDEADEMLKMGFIDDVEWILDQIEHDHQTALFSATMPNSIVAIAKNYLNNPERVNIKTTSNRVDTIEQGFYEVKRGAKLDVLTRVLEVEDLDAAIIFVRTKTMSADLAERLQARGYAAASLNGDMSQSLREKVVEKLKKGVLDIVVATDVAARGIDVQRVSLVVNYDIPYDTESYIHRIGRTGRAGRNGRALLLVTQRERHLLKTLQRVMNNAITRLEPPSRDELLQKRDNRLMAEIQTVLASPKKSPASLELIERVATELDCSYHEIAAALLQLKRRGDGFSTGELKSLHDDKSTSRSKPRRSERGRSSDSRQARAKQGARSGEKGRGEKNKKSKRKNDSDFVKRKKKSRSKNKGKPKKPKNPK